MAAACDGRGVWVVDRGGDRRELYKPLLAGAHSFIIRNTGERHVLAGRRKVETAVLAAQCPMMYATHIVREEWSCPGFVDGYGIAQRGGLWCFLS